MIETGTLPSLVVQGLTIRRGSERIVDAFDWIHEAGYVAWLTGPNGVGKSSIMRVFAGIVAPDGGLVRREVAGSEVPASAEEVAYYNPAMGLPREARAGAFVDLAGRLVGRDIPLSPDRALGRKRCGSLSTGEEKRLLLGPLLARARPFVFLDEPYEHLSREARAELTAELVRLARTSVVVVATNQPVPAEAAGPVVTLSLEEPPVVA